MKKVILMPVYNAEKTIEGVFERIPSKILKSIAKIIVVNDGSTDKTLQIIKRLSKRYNILLIEHETNKGYGAAQKTGFKQALIENADIVILLHSDGQYPPELIEELIEPIQNRNADMVGGSRFIGENMQEQMPFIRYMGNRFLTKMVNFLFRKNLSCYHSGFKAYSKRALKRIDFERYSDCFYFDSEMIIGAIRNNLKIAEIPIPTVYAEEISYLNPITYGLGFLKMLVKKLLGNNK